MESILNQQQTIHNAICGGQSSTKGYMIWCGNNIMGGDYTQQYIYIVEILLYLLQRFSLWKRRDMDNTQQYTTTHKKYNNNLILDIIPLFE